MRRDVDFYGRSEEFILEYFKFEIFIGCLSGDIKEVVGQINLEFREECIKYIYLRVIFIQYISKFLGDKKEDLGIEY